MKRILLISLTLAFMLSSCSFRKKQSSTPAITPTSSSIPTPTPENRGLAPRPANLDTKDVFYASLGHEAQKLDIYLPENAAHPAPVMIYVHGGSWQIGDKSRIQFKDDVFNDAGFIFISVNYRMHPDVVWEEMATDVARAIAWTHENISAYGGDPERIFLMGHSAGAHLVSLVATDERYLTNLRLDLNIVNGVISLDTRAYNIPALAQGNDTLPRAYATIFGDVPDEWLAASPITFVEAGKNIPPMALAWSGGNSGNNFIQREAATREFAEALEAASIPALLVDASDKTHSEINQEFGQAGDALTSQIIAWLEELK